MQRHRQEQRLYRVEREAPGIRGGLFASPPDQLFGEPGHAGQACRDDLQEARHPTSPYDRSSRPPSSSERLDVMASVATTPANRARDNSVATKTGNTGL